MRSGVRRHCVYLLASFICAVSYSLALAAQEFRSTVELVRVQVAAFARDGGPVADLGRDDFTVLENGEERPIAVFLAPRTGPLEVAVAMDVSRSMASWDSRDLFHALLDGLDPASCVLLLPFAEEVGSGVWGRADSSELRGLIDRIPQSGDREAAYEALVAGFALLRDRAGGGTDTGVAAPSFAELLQFRTPRRAGISVDRPRGTCAPSSADGTAVRTTDVRRAVVIVTDERDSASRVAIDDVMLASWGSGIPVFGLAVTAVPDEDLPSIRTRGVTSPEVIQPLERLTKYTGGLVFEATKGRYDRSRHRYVYRDLRGRETAIEGIERLGHALRDHYVLGYSPVRDAGDGQPPIVESVIEVRVARDDVEVRTAAERASGRGRSEGAALDAVLRGFRELADGLPETALETFEAANSLAPSLGVAHYGRALTLTALDEPTEILASLRRARELAPWLPDLDARLAQAHLDSGNLDPAWEHALRAFYRGSEVRELIAKLQNLAPRTVDLTKPPVNPRVAVIPEGQGGLPAMLAAPRITAVIMRLAHESEAMQSGWSPDTSDLLLSVVVTTGEIRGPWISVSGRLVLEDRVGRRWGTEGFRVQNADNRERLWSELEPAFRRMEERVREIHRSPR